MHKGSLTTLILASPVMTKRAGVNTYDANDPLILIGATMSRSTKTARGGKAHDVGSC